MRQAISVSAPSRHTPGDRRERILDAAISLIGERGYYGFTVNALARRCGLSNPGLLHYFPSKQDVLIAALQEMENREAAFMEPLVRAARHYAGGAGSRQAVLAVFRAIVERATGKPELIRFMVELQAESLDPRHPGHEWWRLREAALIDLFAGLLAPFLESPPIPVARSVLALLDGFGAHWLRVLPAIDAVEEWDSAIERLLPELHDGHHVVRRSDIRDRSIKRSKPEDQ